MTASNAPSQIMPFRLGTLEQCAALPGWGRFMAPPAPLADGVDPAEAIGWKGTRRQLRPSRTDNRIWNGIAERINAYPHATSDQCSLKHYQDVFEFLRLNTGVVDRVVECGVFQGGMSVLLAGCALAFDFQLDLIDMNPAALHWAYHRVRLTFPEALPRLRLFFGEIPNYVKSVLADDTFKNAVLHHDGSHDFKVVVRDLASLSYIRSRLLALLIQDTHLRHSNPATHTFVDGAVASVFGFDLLYQPIGVTFPGTTDPEDFERGKSGDVYFVGGRPEGMMIPIAENTFLYPHPVHVIDDFIAFP